MNISRALELLKIYESCPNCGNTKLGETEGNLVVGHDSFKRNCKCGFKVFLKEEK